MAVLSDGPVGGVQRPGLSQIIPLYATSGPNGRSRDVTSRFPRGQPQGRESYFFRLRSCRPRDHPRDHERSQAVAALQRHALDTAGRRPRWETPYPRAGTGGPAVALWRPCVALLPESMKESQSPWAVPDMVVYVVRRQT